MVGKTIRRSFALGLTLTAVLALAGCAVRGKRAGETAPPEASAPGGLKFLVTVMPDRFAIGEKVTLEASMFNQDADTFERKCRTSCVWDYEVTTEDGRRVGPARDCVPEQTELRLEAGELRMIMRNWSGRDRYFGASERLEAGVYLVTAGLVDEGGHVIPMMEPVKFEVVAGR